MGENYTHTYSIVLNNWSEQAWGGLHETCQRPLESARGEVTGSQPNSPSQRGAVGPPSILEMIIPSLCICSVPFLAVLGSLGESGQRIQGLSWLWGLLSRTEQRCREGIRHDCELQRVSELRPESLGLVEGGRVDFAGVKWGVRGSVGWGFGMTAESREGKTRMRNLAVGPSVSF